MPLLANGMAFLAEKLSALESVSVTYTRAGVGVTVLAVVGNQQANAANRAQQGQAIVAWGERDYLIRAADLTAAGIVGEPAIGDRIAQTINAVATVFEAMRGPGGERCWEWSEPERITYRVHAKRVS